MRGSPESLPYWLMITSKVTGALIFVQLSSSRNIVHSYN